MEQTGYDPVITFVSAYFYYVFLGLILVTVMQRRRGAKGQVKRVAMLFQAIAVFLIFVASRTLALLEWPGWAFYVMVAVIGAGLYLLRDRAFPYRLNCSSCGKRLEFNQVYFLDETRCPDCVAADVESSTVPESPEN